MSTSATPALEFLDKPPQKIPPVCVLVGDEALLRREVITRLRDAVAGDDEFSVHAFDGGTVELRDVVDELATVALFGSGRRLAVIDDADEFVTRYRAPLEDYVAKPKSTGVLVLAVKSWPSNTRLAKAVSGSGLTIDCSTPQESSLVRWIGAWAKSRYQTKLEPSAAAVLIEIVGPEMGLLDQELAKLAASAAGQAVSADDVHRLVGSWRTHTTWDMLDATLAGRADSALTQLDQLLRAGEEPIAILGQIGSTLRRLAAAARYIFQAEATGKKLPLRSALESAGFKAYLGKAEEQLKKLGRVRAQQLYRWLLEADMALKGASSGRVAARRLLEQLIVRLSVAVDARPASTART